MKTVLVFISRFASRLKKHCENLLRKKASRKKRTNSFGLNLSKKICDLFGVQILFSFKKNYRRKFYFHTAQISERTKLFLFQKGIPMSSLNHSDTLIEIYLPK